MSRGIEASQKYLQISGIRQNTVILKNGQLRQILAVSSVNFALKSEEEQKAILFAYQNFLNSLEFPIQIVVQSRRLNLDGYAAELKSKLTAQTNELIRLQTENYLDFIAKVLDTANIMDKKFYLVVPLTPTMTGRRSALTELFNLPANIKMPEEKFTEALEKLQERVGLIQSGLAAISLQAKLLTTAELINLLYNIYNPEEMNVERPDVTSGR